MSARVQTAGEGAERAWWLGSGHPTKRPRLVIQIRPVAVEHLSIDRHLLR